MNKVSHKDLSDQVQIYILKRRCGWFGHTLRKINGNITRCGTLGARERGKTKTPGDVTLLQTSRKQLERIVQDRRRWREVVHWLYSRRSQGPNIGQ